jgi:ABC-type tungstate transport system permease subunit
MHCLYISPGRRRAALLGATILALLAPAVANADSAGSLTVIGTSDVSDSGLVANVIQPDFHAAYPQFTFKYIGTASGTAISEAESGSQGASVLIVHAASLENQFVAGGFSYNNGYGYAIFRNDFVLAGPGGDPAGVGSNGSNNIAQAFADIATAGMNGKATFVSRGGSPGTTVEEHQIWSLVLQNNLTPTGLLLCAVSATLGGGETPIASGQGVTASGQPCPNSGALPSGSALPSWYVTTGLTQGPNVIAANACTVGTSGANTCYVLTDRGTYDYLASGLDTAGTIPNLTVLARGPQPATAPGGADALINYFHAYIVNPSAPNETVNLTAAQDFISMLTSTSFQSQLSTYLDDTSDAAGPPFVADASPQLTEVGLPTTSPAGKRVTVTGTLSNTEPGYPALAAQTVSVDEIVAGTPVVVASTKSNTDGTFSVTFVPRTSGFYQVATGVISQVENSTLSPPFGDQLSPAATTPVYLTLQGTPMAHSLGIQAIAQRLGKLTVKGKISPAPVEGGAKIVLFAISLQTGAVQKVGSTALGAGRTAFAIKAKLPRKSRFVLQLEYVQKGQTSIYSGLKTVSVS